MRTPHRRFYLPLLLPLLLVGCRSDGPATPEAVARLVVKAMNQGEAVNYVRTLPTLEEVGQTFDCGRYDLIRGRLMRAREDVYVEFEARRQAGHRLKLKAFDTEGSKTTRLDVGDMFQGCQVLKPVYVHESQVNLELTRSNRVDPTTETWTFLRFEEQGPWNFFRL